MASSSETDATTPQSKPSSPPVLGWCCGMLGSSTGLVARADRPLGSRGARIESAVITPAPTAAPRRHGMPLPDGLYDQLLTHTLSTLVARSTDDG